MSSDSAKQAYSEACSARIAGRNEEALEKILISANAGYVEGMVMAGMFYRDGTGTSKDSVEALKWFTLAADQGDVSGIACLDDVYQDIYGDDWEKYYVPVMERYAAKGYQEAAERLAFKQQYGLIGNFNKEEYEARLNRAKSLRTRHNICKIIGVTLCILSLVGLSADVPVFVQMFLIFIAISIGFMYYGFGRKVLHHKKFKSRQNKCTRYTSGASINDDHYCFRTGKDLSAYITALENTVEKARK